MFPLKLVTFDVTGTLLFYRTPIVEKYISVGAKYGAQTSPETLKKNFKLAWETLNANHPNFGRHTGLGWENWWVKFVELTFADVKNIGKSDFRLIAEELIKFHTTPNAFTIRDGTEDLLTYLKLKGVTLGVISNYDSRLNAVLECVNLKKNFDFVLGSYDFGHPKPDGTIFAKALELGKCSSSAEGIHVGDDIETDYLGAKRAGMRAILMVNNVKDLANSAADKQDVFQDFSTLKSYFERL